jgi:hypothetical protein
MVGRTAERRISLTDRLNKPGPRKLLALDGGGIRGVLSLLILARIEKLLVKQSGRHPEPGAPRLPYIPPDALRGAHLYDLEFWFTGIYLVWR